ncbi:MAG: V-type ATPase subunit [Bacilli bacterium]|nr:V-type ATPase subunit [Bacilli bacterium]
MSSWTSNAIVAKAKSIYGNFLKPEDFDELVKKKSVSEVAAYLKNQKNYVQVLGDVQEGSIHRGQLEELIKKTNFNNTLKLVKFVELKDKSFYELNIIIREIELILATIRSIISENYEEALAEFPTFFIRHAGFDITKLSQVRSFEMLLEALEGTRFHKILEPFNEKDRNQIKYSDIENKLDECYYDCVFERIDANYKGKLKKEVETIFKTKIELANIVKIYRLKKFYNADPKTIKSALILKHSRLSERKIDEIISLPDADLLLHYLERSEYSRYMDEEEYVFIEYYAQKMKYNLAKRYMYFSSEAPKVYSALLILGEIERENLFNIIEGIRYELEESEIKKMLIY